MESPNRPPGTHRPVSPRPTFPGRPHVDLALLHALAARRSTPLGLIAKELGTTLGHIRMLLEEQPLPDPT